MTGKQLLDTNIVVALLNNVPEVTERIRDSEAFVSNTILGELYFGAENSRRAPENVDKIRAFARGITVLPIDDMTAHEYGKIKAQLRRLGKPIPENDIWIAASAIRNDITLSTHDDHFTSVERLKLDLWSARRSADRPFQ